MPSDRLTPAAPIKLHVASNGITTLWLTSDDGSENVMLHEGHYREGDEVEVHPAGTVIARAEHEAALTELRERIAAAFDYLAAEARRLADQRRGDDRIAAINIADDNRLAAALVRHIPFHAPD